MKLQTDILFASTAWFLSSLLFVVTYNFLPAPPEETIGVWFPEQKPGFESAIEKSGICLGTAKVSLQEEQSGLHLQIDLLGVQTKKSLPPSSLKLGMNFDQHSTLERLQGTVTAPKTKIRIASMGSTPLRITLSGKLEGRPISDSFEFPGPITLSRKSSSPNSIGVLFPRKGLLRSGLLEYAEGVVKSNFSFSVHLENERSDCRFIEDELDISDHPTTGPEHQSTREHAL